MGGVGSFLCLSVISFLVLLWRSPRGGLRLADRRAASFLGRCRYAAGGAQRGVLLHVGARRAAAYGWPIGGLPPLGGATDAPPPASSAAYCSRAALSSEDTADTRCRPPRPPRRLLVRLSTRFHWDIAQGVSPPKPRPLALCLGV